MEKSIQGNLSKGQNSVIITQSSQINVDHDAPLIPFGRKRDEDGDYVHCRFINRFKSLSSAQLALGLILFFAGLYTHFPVFSFSLKLMDGEDRLWYATWIGLINAATGIVGRLATKRSIGDGLHRFLRRGYMILNAAFCLYSNGIGIGAYFISLSHYNLISPGPNETFTTIMAFLCIILLIVGLVVNIIGVLYQVLATKQCKCWVCDPKSRRVASILKQLT